MDIEPSGTFVGDLVNIHLEKKLAVWLFPRTGSMLFAKVFQDSGFQCYSYKNNVGEIYQKKLFHHHHFYIFPEINNFDLILTVRNPYSLLVSFFYMNNEVKEIKNIKSEFKEFLEREVYSNPRIDNILNNLNYVEVKYPLRLENLVEDYCNLPIIGESSYFKSNSLVDLINSKYNKSDSNLTKLPISEFYNSSSADLVFYTFSNYFNIFGYDKNSWNYYGKI